MKQFYFSLFLLIFLACKKIAFEDKAVLIQPRILPKIQLEKNAIHFDSMLVVNSNNNQLIEFYRVNGFITVWHSDMIRKIVLDAISEAEKEGLFSEDYHYSLLKNFENSHDKLNENEIVKYDIQLTNSIQQFLSHMKTGKLDPCTIYDNWDIQKIQFDVNKTLLESFANKEMDEIIIQNRPNEIMYNHLKMALSIIETYPDVTFTPISYEKNIVANEKNEKINSIKKRLYYWKDYKNDGKYSTIYDKNTIGAVKRFQERHGLVPDGVIGKGTIDALNISKSDRKKQIIANLERWKWFQIIPNQDYVMVNIPDFELQIVENKDTTMTQKVVVGTSKRKTPVLSSVLKTVVLNPTWTIPPTILYEDVLPEIKRNRNYLYRKNILIYDNKNNVVSPSNWNSTTPQNYRYVQAPGPNNTLGEMKILFPNNYSIYLHDTNYRNVFGLNSRSLSSGCIRVEKPIELAGYFLNHSANWSKEKIDSIITTRKTHNIRIMKKYNIYIWYWTAWSHKGQLHFRKDIYDYDLDLYHKLRK